MAQPEFAQHDSVVDLIRGILGDIQTLIREEIALARLEIQEHAGRMKTVAMTFGIAVTALAFGGTFLLIAAALGIAYLLNWPAWAGFLVLAMLLVGTGGLAFLSARKRLTNFRVLPAETISTVKENSEWIAKRLSSVRK